MDKYIGVSVGLLYDYFAQKRTDELIGCIPGHYKVTKTLGNPQLSHTLQGQNNED